MSLPWCREVNALIDWWSRLAVCADRDLGEESKMSGNNLWSVVVGKCLIIAYSEYRSTQPLSTDFLTQTPDRNAKSTDPLTANSDGPSDPTTNLDINVQPPTPSSPHPPAGPPPLPRKRSSTFLRKLIGRDPAAETPRSTTRRPLSLFIDSSRNSGLPVLDKP
jgi:hypothetical protein